MKKLMALFLCSALLLVGCGQDQQPDSTLNVEVLKIGKADCSIITINGLTLMIDTGEDEDAPEILSYLEDHHIDTINYLIITHYDKDHIGGADQILNSIPVEEVFEPGYAKESTDYDEYVAALSNNQLTPLVLKKVTSFQMADATVTIYPPEKSDYAAGDNDFSLVTTITHGENSFLFAGDAEAERLEEIMTQIPLGQTFLKVPHHGNLEANSEAFLAAVHPKYAVITCSNKNPASDEILSLLDDLNTQTYLTVNGNISCISNGHHLTILQ